MKFGNTLSFRFKWTHRGNPSCFNFWVWAGLALSVEERKIKVFCAITASTVVSQISRYLCKKKFDPGRTRTCNPLIRSQMPCPLGHRTSYTVFGARENPSLTTLQPKLKQQVLNLQLGTKMHQFGIRGRDGCIQKWKFWIGRKIMSDYQDRLLWMGTQTAARGVLAMYLQKSVILAATLCLLPREFHCRTNAFWKIFRYI